MRALQKTLAMIAFLVLVSQTLRHSYMLWVQPRGSVLDKYDGPTKGQITAATSLDELLRRYDSVRKEVELAKQEQSKTQEQPPPWFQDNQKEPFKSEQMLREAIVEWEDRWKQIRELRFYWLIGLALFTFGVVMYRKWNRWFGLGLLIAGLSEFIYWTSPTFIGGTREFEKLLANKLALSVVSLVLLILAIWMLDIFSEKGENPV